MCLNSMCIFGIITLLSTKVIGKFQIDPKTRLFWPKTSFQNSRFIANVPSIFSDESKRAIYRDIKNHIDNHSGSVDLSKKKRRLSKVPSIYLEPPKLVVDPWKKKRLHDRQKGAKYDVTPIPTISNSDEKKTEEIRLPYVRDHAPLQHQTEEPVQSETKERKNEKEEEETTDRNRIDFHFHNHEGPDTYIFGFDTGNGKNRQFRMEERHENGTVNGHYGYYDARGKLRKVYYSSNPSNGYSESLVNKTNNFH